jgi:hypothetical protein
MNALLAPAPSLHARLNWLDQRLAVLCPEHALLVAMRSEHEAPAGPDRFAAMAAVYSLTSWEVLLLLMGAAQAWDARYSEIWDSWGGCTAALAAELAGLSAWERVESSASLLESGALRRFSLLEFEGGGPIAQRSIRLPDAVVLRLAGLGDGMPLGPVLEADDALMSGLELTEKVLTRAGQLIQEVPGQIAVRGRLGSGREAFSVALAGRLGWRLLDGRGSAAPESELRRDLMWWDAALLCEKSAPQWVERAVVVQRVDAPLLLSPSAKVFDLPELTEAQRAQVWGQKLKDPDLGQQMAARYRAGPAGIEQIVAQSAGVDAESLAESAGRLSVLAFGKAAERLPADCGWEKLQVSPSIREELDLAVSWVKHGTQVFEEWGLGGPNPRPGLSCLFHGPPGTGKTLAARVLGAALGLQVYRIDLAQTVSKYIGETEKNLSGLFDAARDASVLLFFDEADALFGKRTEVRSSNDRHANNETGYLLQRLEGHPGPVVMATNLLANMDGAFLRRMHIIAEFALPDSEQLERIWHLHLPLGVAADLPLGTLSRSFPISGADVRNACIIAGLLAAREKTAIQAKHVVLGLARELRKSGRLVEPGRFGPFEDLVRSQLRVQH